MKNYTNKIQIIAAVSFLLLYFDEGKISWFTAFYLPTVTALTLGGLASPIFEIFHTSWINSVISVLYLIIVFASSLYVLRQGIKNKGANKLSIVSGLFMYSFVFFILAHGNHPFSNIVSIIGLTIFIIFNLLSMISVRSKNVF